MSLLCTTCYVLAARHAAPWRFGVFEQLALPRPARWAVEILVLDFLAYLLHRLYHRNRFFWRFHSVHHTDLDLDVTSASRFHLGEVAASGVAKLVTVQPLGISPSGLVAFEIVMLLAAQFQHANIALPAACERVLWWTLVPPAMHRVHHRPPLVETSSNYGTLITLWDRLLGTLRTASTEPSRFGLPEFRQATRLGPLALLGLPFRRRPGPD